MRKAWAIEQAGFVMNPRVVLAMGFFDGFRERNGIGEALRKGAPANEIYELVWNGKFSEEEVQTFKNIVKGFGGVPVAIRSSAHGDCRGTGIYESNLYSGNVDDERCGKELIYYIRLILLSEFSRDAISFRKDMGLSGGMAIIIEPVFGISFDVPGENDGLFRAPQLGGLAFTSNAEGKGCTYFVEGLPTCAVNGDGVRADEGNDMAAASLLDEESENPANPRKCFLDSNLLVGGSQAIRVSDGHCQNHVAMPHGLGHLSLGWLFRKLKALETRIGKPQYVEWAAIERDGKPEAAILQIADIDMKADCFEFTEHGLPVARSNFVVGTGERICNGMVILDDLAGLETFYGFNENASNYLFVCSGYVLSHCRIRYQRIRNAAVLAELFEKTTHRQHPISHFEGMLEASGKLFMTVSSIDLERLEPFRTLHVDAEGNQQVVYEAKFRVTTSERQQKGIIELIEG